MLCTFKRKTSTQSVNEDRRQSHSPNKLMLRDMRMKIEEPSPNGKTCCITAGMYSEALTPPATTKCPQ